MSQISEGHWLAQTESILTNWYLLDRATLSVNFPIVIDHTTSNFPHIGTNFLHAITNPSWLLIMLKYFYLHDLLAWNCFSIWSWRRSLWWSHNFSALCRYMPCNHLSNFISSSTIPFNSRTHYLSKATQTHHVCVSLSSIIP
jgi:hypothetical protein